MLLGFRRVVYLKIIVLWLGFNFRVGKKNGKVQFHPAMHFKY